MGVIAKQDVAFSFGAVKQSRNKRSLQAGELVEAINVRQVLEEGYRKRFGYDRSVPTPSSGSATTPWDSFTFDGERPIAMDADGEVWSKNGSSLETRGTAKRAFPTISSAATGRPYPQSPLAVTVGTNTWIFTVHHTVGTVTAGYSWAIFDSDGNIIKPAAFVTLSGLFSLAAATDGTNVWVLTTTTSANSVVSYKYTVASPSTAPTSATYWAGATASAMVDMHTLASGSIAVAVAYRVTTNATLRVSYLDTATGAEKASPAAVAFDIDGGAADTNPSIGPPSILTSDGSNGKWYVTMWGPASSTAGSATDNNLCLFIVTASTLSVAMAAPDFITNANPTMGWACGYLDTSNGNLVLFSCVDTYTGTPVQPRNYTLKRYICDGAGSLSSSSTLRIYSYPVSKPQKVGSSWYLVTGYDDGPAQDFEKSYFLIDSDGNILTQIAYAQAAAAGLTYDPSVSLTEGRGFTTPLRVQGNKLQCGLLVSESTQPDGVGFAISFVSCDLAATYGAPLRLRDGLASWPGGVPVVAGTADNHHEIALMLSPPKIASFGAGGGTPLAGAQVVQAVYRITDADGTIYRSAPSPAESTTFTDSGATVGVPSLTHLMPGATCQVEIYISDVSGTQPYLNAIGTNDTANSTTNVAVRPEAIDPAETIYTFGGGIDNAPVPPSRTIGMWRNRTILAYRSELWPSLERETGLGPRFNENFVTLWDEGEGDIIAHAPVDWNFYALFKRNAIGVISGQGPFPTPGGGVTGNYEVQTLRTHHCDPVLRSVVTGPAGCYFQSNADGRIYCVTGQDVIDVSQGMESYTAERVTAANYVARDRQIHFHMDSGAIMVLDVVHPTADQPAGRWMRWYSSGLLAAAGAAVDASGAPMHLEAASGAVRTQGTGYTDATSGAAAAVLMDLTTGDLGAAGGIRSGYRLDGVHIDGEWLAENTIKITVTSDYGITSTEHTSAAITAAPQEGYCRPRGHGRVRSTRIRVQETVSAGAGFIFQGITLTVQPFGRAKFPSNARRIA